MKVLHDIDQPQVCIVHFQSQEGMPRIIYYQVTVDPEAFSPGGFVRFGDCAGDEIHGWQRAEEIVIDEVLDAEAEPIYVRERKPIKAAA